MVDKVGDVEDATGILLSFAFYICLLIFQSGVFGHFLYKIYDRELSNKIKFATLSVLFIAWIGICFEFITILLNLSYPFPKQNGYCSTITWLRYNWFIIFELTLYIFWIIRIYHSFKYSVFEIKTKNAILMCLIVSLICLIFLILTSISMQPQYKEINFSLNASQQTNGFDCIAKLNIGGILVVYIIGQITTLLFNIFFASLFFYKLHKLQMVTIHETGSQGDMRELRLFQLMQKHTLLTAISVLISIICWLIFDIFYSQDMLFILAIDRVSKSLCIILMYKCYETIVTKLCGCCLRLTHGKCMSKKVKELFPYFNPNPQVKTATIYAQCHAIVSCEDMYGEDVSLNESMIKEIGVKTTINMTPSPAPNRPLPSNMNHSHLLGARVNKTPDKLSSVASHSRDLSISKSKSYEKALPQIDFGVNPYKMLNFIACLTDPQRAKLRYLEYSAQGYQIIATQIFSEIDIKNEFENHGVVIMDGFQFDQNKFSFLRKYKTIYPYKLAIRLKDHHQHIEDAYKLLKYAEYKLNQTFKKIKKNTSFGYEEYFDDIAHDLATGKLIQHGGSANFMTLQDFAMQRPKIQIATEQATSQYNDHKAVPPQPLTPITPVQSNDYQ